MTDKNLGSTSQLGLGSTLQALKTQTMLSMNCVQIGEIQSFDAETQTATIKISMKQVKDIAEDGTRTLEEYPLLVQCPVFFLFGGLDFLSMPIIAGDSCIILFNDREIDQWFVHGNGQTPLTIRTHDLSDAIALVGIRPLTNAVVGYITNGIRLSHGNGNTTLDLKTNLIETVATLLLHHGNMQVTGNALVEGNLEVDGDSLVKGDSEVEGDQLIDGGLTVLGVTRGNAGTVTVDADVVLTPGHTFNAPVVHGAVVQADNGVSGTFAVSVTVVNGIVTGGI